MFSSQKCLHALRRWRFQFSLATMFFVLTVLGVWGGAISNRAHSRHNTVAAILAAGGTVGYTRKRFDPGMAPPPLLDEFVDDVIGINLTNCDVGDDLIAQIAQFRKLTGLILSGTPTTDKGAAALCGLHELEGLYLNDTNVEGESLRLLGDLPTLAVLFLDDTAVGDQGVRYLESARNLTLLSLNRTKVTDKGNRSRIGRVWGPRRREKIERLCRKNGEVLEILSPEGSEQANAYY